MTLYNNKIGGEMFSALHAGEAVVNDNAPKLLPLNMLSQYSNDKQALIEELRRTRSRLLTALRIPEKQRTGGQTIEYGVLCERIKILTKLIQGKRTDDDDDTTSSSSDDDDESQPPSSQRVGGRYERYKAGG